MVLDRRFHIRFIMTAYYKMRQILLQNATDIITKCDGALLQNASGVLLQNVTVISKCDVYYKLRQYMCQDWISILNIITRTCTVVYFISTMKEWYLWSCRKYSLEALIWNCSAKNCSERCRQTHMETMETTVLESRSW